VSPRKKTTTSPSSGRSAKLARSLMRFPQADLAVLLLVPFYACGAYDVDLAT